MVDDRRHFELVGWALFGLGVLAFLVQSIRDGEPLAIIGSALFMLGVVSFLVPYVRGR